MLPAVAEPNPWAWGWTAVESIAVSAAFLAAAAALHLERKASRKRDEDAAQRHADRLREQASGVAVWLSGGPRPVGLSGNRVYADVTFRNGSSLPITHVVVSVYEPTPGKGRAFFVPYLPVMEPGEEQTHPLPRGMSFGGDSTLDVSVLEMLFTDANGREWCRDGTGVLVPAIPGRHTISRPVVPEQRSRWWQRS